MNRHEVVYSVHLKSKTKGTNCKVLKTALTMSHGEGTFIELGVGRGGVHRTAV